jgi:hypothetical protein
MARHGLRKIFGHKRDEVTGEWRTCTEQTYEITYIKQNTVLKYYAYEEH